MYARALHMNPGRSSAWGDAASTFYIEAQLRRAHYRLCPEDSDALCKACVTCVKGVLQQFIETCMLGKHPLKSVPGHRHGLMDLKNVWANNCHAITHTGVVIFQ